MLRTFATKRFALFLGLVAALVVAVGFAAVSTGAWFSDTSHVAMNSTAGTLEINGPGEESLAMDVQGLMPGVGTTKTVTVTNTGSADAKVFFKYGAISPSGAPLIVGFETAPGDYYGNFDQYPGVDSWVPMYHGQVNDIRDDGIILKTGEKLSISVSLSLNASAGNEWQGKSMSFPLTVLAQQVEAPNPA